MAIKDWNGFKKNGDSYIPNDSTSREGIGTLSSLLTTAKNNLVAAINEVFTKKISWADAGKYVGKNKLPITLAEVKALNTSGTWNGNVYTFRNVALTFTVENGYVTKVSATGQANADTYVPLIEVPSGTYRNMILSGCPTGGSGQTYAIIGQNLVDAAIWNYGGDLVITNDNQTKYRITLFVHNGYSASNVEYTPMVRPANTPEGFEPYIPDNTELMTWEANAKTGVHQLYNFNLAEIKSANSGSAFTWNDNVCTVVGATLTFNNDMSITISGTLTGALNFRLSKTGDLGVNAKRFTLGIDSNDIASYIYDETVGTDIKGYTKDGVIVPTNYHNYRLVLNVKNGAVLNNVTVYPMVLVPEDTYRVLTPYAMTNKELTEKVTNKDAVTVTAGTNVSINANTKMVKNGNIASGSLRLEFSGTITAGQTIATLSAKPKEQFYAVAVENITAKTMPVVIATNGDVVLFGGFVPTADNQLIIPISYITA